METGKNGIYSSCDKTPRTTVKEKRMNQKISWMTNTNGFKNDKDYVQIRGRQKTVTVPF